MSKIDREINDHMMNTTPIVEHQPSAWELRVRRTHPEVTTWKRYNIYETLERAQKTVENVNGPPLEVKIVPLYAEKEAA